MFRRSRANAGVSLRDGRPRAERVKRRGGTRVELNALDAQSFVAFIEDKLERHGLGKVTPDAAPLGEAYAAFVRANRIRARLGPEIDAINSELVDVPDDLAERVRAELETNPDTPWDAVVAALANDEEVES